MIGDFGVKGTVDEIFQGYLVTVIAIGIKTLGSKGLQASMLYFFRGGVVGWGSSLQRCFAWSSTKFQYFALFECIHNIWYYRRLLMEFDNVIRPAIIYKDKQSYISSAIGE